MGYRSEHGVFVDSTEARTRVFSLSLWRQSEACSWLWAEIRTTRGPTLTNERVMEAACRPSASSVARPVSPRGHNKIYNRRPNLVLQQPRKVC
jgi:hypothetical protein